MPLPKIAVVILSWNGKKFLQQFLPSVLASSYFNFELIVADNGSTDDSIPFMEQNYPAIRIIQFDQNLGFAMGYNKALIQVEADYYVLLNSDVEVSPGWIEPVTAQPPPVPQPAPPETAIRCRPRLTASASGLFRPGGSLRHRGSIDGVSG